MDATQQLLSSFAPRPRGPAAGGGAQPDPAQQFVDSLTAGFNQFNSALSQMSRQRNPRQRGLNVPDLEATTATMTYEGTGDIVGGNGGNGSNSSEQCMVCMQNFFPGDELRILPCFHRYHRGCVDQWLRQHQECPVCKHRVAA